MNRYIRKLGALALGTYMTLSLMGCNGVQEQKTSFEYDLIDKKPTQISLSSKENPLNCEDSYIIPDLKSGNLWYIENGKVMSYESKVSGNPIIVGNFNPNINLKGKGIEDLLKAIEKSKHTSLEKTL